MLFWPDTLEKQCLDPDIWRGKMPIIKVLTFILMLFSGVCILQNAIVAERRMVNRENKWV